MKNLLKITLVVFILIAYVYISGFAYADELVIQILMVAIVLLLSMLRFKRQRFINELRLILPFIATMLIVYILLGLARFNPNNITAQNNILKFWFNYGLCRAILFSGTVFFFQYILSYITMNDIISLPLSVYHKRYLILGRSLFIHSVNNIGNLELHIKLMPEYQKKRLTIKQWFYIKLQLTMSLIIMVLRESRIKGELIDNRIRHCFVKDYKEVI